MSDTLLWYRLMALDSIRETLEKLECYAIHVHMYADTRCQIKRGESVIADVPFYLLETTLGMLLHLEETRQCDTDAPFFLREVPIQSNTPA